MAPSRGNDDRRSRERGREDRGYDRRGREGDREERGRDDRGCERRGERQRSVSGSRRQRSRSRRRGRSASPPKAAGDAQSKRSKWDEKTTEQNEYAHSQPASSVHPLQSQDHLPDWLRDVQPLGRTGMPRSSSNYKVIRMQSIQIRVLLGKGGETIREITQRTGADIKIDNQKDDPEGNVSIVGDIERTEAVIREVLASKGCPLPEALLMPGSGAAPAAAEEELSVPVELVGLFIGKSGENIRIMREQAGGSVFIGVQKAEPGSNVQKIQIVGDNREKARQLVKDKIAEVHGFAVKAGKDKGGKGKGKGPVTAAGMSGIELAMQALPLQSPGVGNSLGIAAGWAMHPAAGAASAASSVGVAELRAAKNFVAPMPKKLDLVLGEEELTAMMNEMMSWGCLLAGDTSGWG